MRRVLWVVLTVLPALAAADILHMADGSTREGRVIETTDKEVVVDFGHGSMSLMVRLPRSDVVKIEHKATPHDDLMAEYQQRLARAQRGGADGWHALGAWCAQQRVLNDKAREAFERALALDADHADAHAALGHVKLNDTWMTRQRAVRILAPELADGAAKARELAARKQAEEATARALELEARAKELETEVGKLQKENETLRQRLAAIPPPPPPEYYRPRVIYRPIIIYRDRDKGGSSPPKGKPKDDKDDNDD